MNPPLDSFALLANEGSSLSKTYSEIAGTFDRSGRTLAPAGIMSSVVILSATFIKTRHFNFFGKGSFNGTGLILGPRIVSVVSPLSADGGEMRMLSSIG